MRTERLVARRSFIARASLALFALGASVSAACTGQRGPPGSFGGKLTIHERPEDIIKSIKASGQPRYVAAGRFYLITYESGDPSMKIYERQGVASRGLMTLYQRCTHLGCRVPFCRTSEFFECPCHLGVFNRRGEYQLGPAQRGMDRFPLAVTNNSVTVDTGTIVIGPERGANTTQQRRASPSCV